jgi:hypothetical protein
MCLNCVALRLCLHCIDGTAEDEKILPRVSEKKKRMKAARGGGRSNPGADHASFFLGCLVPITYFPSPTQPTQARTGDGMKFTIHHLMFIGPLNHVPGPGLVVLTMLSHTGSGNPGSTPDRMQRDQCSRLICGSVKVAAL